MSAPPAAPLIALAGAYGVATDYWDWQGRHVEVSADTLIAVLAALGVSAQTPEQVDAVLADLELRSWRRCLPATVVTRVGWTPWVPVHVSAGTAVAVRIELEDGSTRDALPVDHWVEPRIVDDVEIGEATFALPDDLPPGYHRLVAELVEPALDPTSTTSALIVTPQRLDLPPQLDSRAIGLMTQLYQVRSETSWGTGDFGDLATMAGWAGRDLEADFLLINPVHAAEPSAPMEPSPYLPTTRRFVNPLYLRVEDIPEAQTDEVLPTVRDLATAAHALNAHDVIDRDAAWALKRAALEEVYALGLGPERAADLADFRRREGEGLERFATWCAIADVHGRKVEHWPTEFASADTPEVLAFAGEHAETISFYCWLQWLCARQLAAAQAAARTAGMRLGIIHDLAVGVHPTGADAWGLRDALAGGVSVGAPPDQFNQLGQDWSQPPWRPDRLAELGYAPYRDMVRAVLRDAGGVRADHIIGLFRLWWIPQGGTPAEGTYVHYDHEALIGILVLEASRSGAVVVGEDLGVVAPHARDYLLERGILGTSILWFEWEGDWPKPPEHYRELCLSSVTTHDLPPTAGYLGLTHVDVRASLGLLTRPVEEERAVEWQAIERVREVLVGRGLLDPSLDVASPVGIRAVTWALHRLLAQTPSRLLAAAVSDLVGDRRAINQPGTSEEYPNWRLPLTDASGHLVRLEDLMSMSSGRALLDALRGH